MDLGHGKVDRQSTTPFYLKLFYKNGGFHRAEEFNNPSDLPSHVQIYTWQTCTLRELSHLLTSALPNLLPSPAIGTRLSFRLIFPDTRNAVSGPPKYITKELGSVVIGDGGPGILPDEEEASIVAGGVVAGALGGEPHKTLQDAKFVIGDYISCAVLPPMANGNVAHSVASTRGAFGNSRPSNDFGRGRENGFGGFRGRGGPRGGGGNFGQINVPSGEWRRGERLPEGNSRGRGYGFGGGRGARW